MGTGASARRGEARGWRRASLRWKLFALISGTVAAPVVAVAVYFPASQIAAQERGLVDKAMSLALASEEDVRPAIAFDDSVTAREEFDSTANDPDVALLAIFRADGVLLEARGTGELHPPPATDRVVVSVRGERVRVVQPVLTKEGPRGLLVVELSRARILADGARVRRAGLLVAALALLFGFASAYVAGRTFGRRIGLLKMQALRVAGGDLSEMPRLDTHRDEIGELAGVFHDMVKIIDGIVSARTEALSASRAQLAGLLESTNAMPWQTVPGPVRFDYLGAQATGTFGGSDAEWNDPAFWASRVAPEDSAAIGAAFAEALVRKADGEIEFRFQRDDGKTLWIRMLMSAGRESGADVLRGFMFDVTERRRLEVELRLAQKLESIGRLAGGMAHEINTPIQYAADGVYFVRDSVPELLRVIEKYQAVVALVRDGSPARAAADDAHALEQATRLGYLTANLPGAIDSANEGLSRIAGIVSTMQEFAHAEEKEMAPVDLNRTLQNLLAVARNEYKYVADVETEFGELPMVTCHAGDINQALLNILVNAAQAVAEAVEGTKERGRIRIQTRTDGGDVIVGIGDTGRGIPEAIRGKIFDLFFTSKPVGKGTGQGLAIARTVVTERHDGDLTFDTKQGCGTTFHVRLPISGKRPPAP